MTRTHNQSYRCRLRAYDHACADDAALDTFVQLKAPDATEAMRLANLVTGCAVIDAERRDS